MVLDLPIFLHIFPFQMKLTIFLILLVVGLAWAAPAQEFTDEDIENWQLLEQANDELDDEKRQLPPGPDPIPDQVLEESKLLY